MALFSNIGSGDLATMQAQLDEQRATAVGNLTPNQIYQQMAYKAGSGLTRGIGGLLGADMVDPELKRRSERTRIVSAINPQDEESLKEGVANLQKAGFAEDAFALSSQLLERQKKLAQINSEQALTAQRGREGKVNDPFQKLVEQGIYTPESLAKYKESGLVTDLQRYEKVKEQTERKTRTETVGGRRLLIDALTGETIKDLGAASKTLEESLGAGLGTLGKALAKGQEAEAKETGGFAAKDFNALGSSVAAGTASKRNIVVLENAMKNAFTGKFADVKEGVVTGLEGLGIKVGDDLRKAASNTQLVNAMGTRYVFPLVKNFPGSLAAKELERLEKTAPNALQQPETIETLMNLLKQDLAENEYTYTKAKQYKEANKGSAIGFNQADAKIEFQNKLTDLRSKVQSVRKAGHMTAAERDQINALKKELGVD